MLGVRFLRLTRQALRRTWCHRHFIPTTTTIHCFHSLGASAKGEDLVSSPTPFQSLPEAPNPILSKSTLVVDGNISEFPADSYNSFLDIRRAGLPYFDRTGYIPILDKVRVIMFLRPRRFGKSLTLSMLRHFYGVEHKKSYGLLFKGLDVDKHVIANKIKHSEYIVLSFDFSSLTLGPDLNRGFKNLANLITISIEKFYVQYEMLLGISMQELTGSVDVGDPINTLQKCLTSVVRILKKVEERGDSTHPLAGVKGVYFMVDEYDAFFNRYLDPHGKSNWKGSVAEELIKSFWATIKEFISYEFGIKKVFITGISPLSLADIGSGFNIASNVSFKKSLSGLCGLTRADIVATLEQLCGQDEVRIAGYLKNLTKFANGYHFCGTERVEMVYNTNTCLEYFQSLFMGETLVLEHPPNSEVAEALLTMCARSDVAVEDMQTAMFREADGGFKNLPYRRSEVGDYLTADDLYQDNKDSLIAWRKIMLYHGGFTFNPEYPSEYIRIPNLIAAGRFGNAILKRYSLLESFKTTLKILAKDGDIKPVIAGYQKMMVARDAGYCNYGKTEDIHRDSMYFGILTNYALASSIEFKVTKRSGTPGRIDLFVLSTKHFVLTEWKNVNISFLDNVEDFTQLDVNGVLKLKFNKYDKFGRGGKTIRYWIEERVAEQLQEYVQSPDVKQACGERTFHAHLVLVVGSRHILLWDMDKSGKWIGQPVLADNLEVQAWEPKKLGRPKKPGKPKKPRSSKAPQGD